jgi:hypothetical protein
MAEPGVTLFIPYRSPTNALLFFIFEEKARRGC